MTKDHTLDNEKSGDENIGYLKGIKQGMGIGSMLAVNSKSNTMVTFLAVKFNQRYCWFYK